MNLQKLLTGLKDTNTQLGQQVQTCDRIRVFGAVTDQTLPNETV